MARTGGAIPAQVVPRDKAVAELVTVTTAFLPFGRVMTLATLVFGALALAGVSVPWPFVATSAVVGIAVSLGATYFPRRTAKRMTIIESLRFD